MSRAWSRRLLACSVFAFSLACAGGEPEVPSLARPRPLLAATGSSSYEAESARTRPLGPLVETEEGWSLAANWRVEAERSELMRVPPDEGPMGLYLFPDQRARVLVEGPFDPSSFNGLKVRMRVRGAVRIQASLLRDGEYVLRTPFERLPTQRGAFDHHVDLTRTRFLEGEVDSLEIALRGGEGPWGILSAELTNASLEHLLPSPRNGARMVTLAGEGRQALALSSREPLAFGVEAADGSELRFAIGCHAELVPPAGPLVAHLRLSGAAELDRAWTLGAGEDLEPGQWSEVALGLPEPGSYELEFRLSYEGVHEAHCLVSEPLVVTPAESAPTVLLVTSDTHRGDHLGAAHTDVEVLTPFLDELAECGVLFEDCYSTTNVTLPSHAALMTATHPRDTRLSDNFMALSERAPTLAQRFREAGWMALASVSLVNLGHEGSGLGTGFDRMSVPDLSTRRGRETIDDLMEWIDEAEGVPLFVWLHVFDAHVPYDPESDLLGLYYPAERDPRDPSMVLEVDPLRLPESMRDLRDLAFPEAQYRAEISYVDRELRRLVELPRIEGGVVAFTSDHGESLTLHGIYFDHAELYPDSLHVPLILCWPGGPRGERREQAVSQLDLGRTLLDLAGLEQSAFPGESLATPKPVERPRFAISAGRTSASITLGRWHLIRHLTEQWSGGIRRDEGELELYDLAADPDCLDDLVDARADQAAELSDALVRWLDDERDTGWARDVELTEAERSDLADLGYVQGER